MSADAGGCGGIGTAARRGSPPFKKQLKNIENLAKKREAIRPGWIDRTGWVVPAGCKPVLKTCRGCLKKRHIWVDCPNNVEKAVVGKDGTEDDWEDDEEYRTFVIEESHPQDIERESHVQQGRDPPR